MAKLILSLDGTVIKEVPLDKERLTIGRRPHNDLQIDNLAVSGEHALIVTILKDSFLEDLGSTNGTLVNGVPIKKHILQHNDVVEIGKYKLKYMVENLQPGAQQAAAAADFEKTMVIRPGAAARAAESGAGKGFGAAQVGVTTQPSPTGQQVPVGMTTAPPPLRPTPAPAPAATAAPAAAMPRPSPAPATGTQSNIQPISGGAAHPVGAIQILSGPSLGKELELVKNLTTLGKPGVQVAVITRRPQGYFITHVEGANFPVVNGKTLDAQAHPLRDHDVVELAGVKMEFFIKGG
jgi:pSer/pThr/pTyr-binding forkhead associated (FHA) protein